jgi:hypothetical protein
MFLAYLTLLADQSPEPEDVKAGWLAFGIFLGLAAAVVLLGFSLVKQLRKAQAAEDSGVYGSDPTPPAQGPVNPQPGNPEPANPESDERP